MTHAVFAAPVLALALLLPAAGPARAQAADYESCVAQAIPSLKMPSLGATVKLLYNNVHRVRGMADHSACVLKGIGGVTDHKGYMALQGDCSKALRGRK